MTEHLLRRDEAAAYLQNYGLRTTPESLATLATRGGGPSYVKIGRYCLYRLSDLNQWISLRCSGLIDSTSTSSGMDIDHIFGIIPDNDDIDLCTGHTGFDEITLILEREVQELIDNAQTKYDEQFHK